MSLLSSVFRSADFSISDLKNPAKWLMDWSLGRKTRAGEYVNEQTSLSLAAYYACMRCIAEDIAKLPLLTYQRIARGKERATEHWAYKLLHDRPNPMQTSFTFREVMTSRAVSWGGGFAEIEKNGRGETLALWPIHPSRVTIEWETDTRIRYLVRGNRNSNQPSRTFLIPPERMFHVRGLGDEIYGWSVARIGAESLGLAMAAQSFGAGFFGNGSHPIGVLEHPDKLEPEAQDKLRRDWSEMYTGPENAFKPAILEQGMKWNKLGIPPNEAQFLETRQFQTEEICRWFRMPPHKIQHLLRSTFSNIEEQSIEYVVDTLTPWAVRWEQEIAFKILNLPQDEEIFAEHLLLGLLRGDQTKRSNFMRTLFGIGALSQNDIREIENMNTIGPDGDVYYVPLNMIRSELAATAPMPGTQTAQPEPEQDDDGDEDESPDGDSGGDDAGDDDSEDDKSSLRQISRLHEVVTRNREANGGFVVPPKMVKEMKEAVETGEWVRNALAPVLNDACQQVMRKEEKAAERAIKRCAGNLQAFEEWMTEFYTPHALFVRDALKPSCEAGAILFRDDEPWDTTKLSISHVEESQSFLRALFVSGVGMETVADFAARRAKALAQEALEGICECPSH